MIKFLSLTITLIVYSCSSVRLNNRKDSDIYLDANSYNKIGGNYNNLKVDTIKSYRSLYSNFNFDSIYKQKNIIINFDPINKNTINLKVINNGKAIDSLSIKGKYRRGYFKMRRNWNINFIAGPFLWIINDNIKYLGLSKDDNLIILNSGSGGVMMLVAFPIFATQSTPFENEYIRIK